MNLLKSAPWALALLPAAVLAQQNPAPTKADTAATVVLGAVTVLGDEAASDELPGATTLIDQATLKQSRVFTTNEALRKAPGVNVRDEEGLGLRPNIGIRGLNPTRSTKVLLLEDGIPLAYAPYGDNASYYHPPVTRFERIEVLKGSAMNQYGPQTIGAVINYVTPTPTQETQGVFSVAGGNRGYFDAQGRFGANGLLLDFSRKISDGARDNTDSKLEDFNLKGLFELSANQTLVLRVNQYREESNVTYTGLTDAEYANFGREYNPFDNDTFDATRYGGSVTHELSFGSDDLLTTNIYVSHFSRDWWRQASTTTDTQCNATTYTVGDQTLNFQQARFAGVAVDPDQCNSAQGRLRDYYTYGVEPRVRITHASFGLDNELVAGLRAHRETQDRIQENATTPQGRGGARSENNKRELTAYAAFAQNRFGFGRLAVTPGLRLESIDYTRRNRLQGREGEESLSQLIPSLGATFAVDERYTLFASVHEGFAPPRVEDILSNGSATADITAVEIDAEKSINAEAGVRARPLDALRFELVVFRNDFDNLISVGSIAGGGVPLSQGEALFQGVELSGRADLGKLIGWSVNPFVELSYTGLPTARSEGAFTRADNGAVVPGTDVSRRLPYAPRHLFTGTLGYELPLGITARLEAVYIGDQYADFFNARSPEDAAIPTASRGSGQFGEIDDVLVWNAAINWRRPGSHWTLFATTKNFTDEDYIVDRTRGIQTGSPRLIQAGIEYQL